MVERWEIDRPMNWQAMMVRADDGKFMLASDYEQLRAELEREIERLQEEYDASYGAFAEAEGSSTAAQCDARAQHCLTVLRRLSNLIKEHGGGGSGSEPCRRCGSRKCAEQQEARLDLLEAMDDDD